jgi:folate-binding protein YgfZ
MTDACYALLEDRGVLEIGGADRREFLQGLISNDTRKLSPSRALYAAFLTPQGKYLHDFFLAEVGEAIYLDGERARLPDLARRLSLYKLRAKVTLADVSDRFVAAVALGRDAAAKLGLSGERGAATPFASGIAYVDPRLDKLGVRLIVPRSGAVAALEAAGLERTNPEVFDQARLAQGVPDGSRDLVIEKTILLEAGFDELNGVDWEKGCYIGQELTARTKYRGLIKKRLLPVTVQGPLPEPGTMIKLGDHEAGEMRSGRGDQGLALLRLDAVDEAAKSGAALLAGTARIVPTKPEWAKFSES